MNKSKPCQGLEPKSEIKLTETDLKTVYGPDYRLYREKILSNCYCSHCKEKGYESTIINYEIFLNDINDITLRGFCAACGGKVARYLETGEVPAYLPRIKKVRSIYGN